MKQFKINYNGKEETIQIDDNPTMGVISPIIKRTLKDKVGQTQPEVDTDEWLIGLATNVIQTAPWKTQDVDALRKLDWKTWSQLATILGDEYPLVDFLSPRLKAMYGKLLDKVESPSPTESITSLPSGESPSDK